MTDTILTQFDKMVQLLQNAYPMRSEIVPCLVGPVGIGKTAAVEKHAEMVGADLTVIIASQILPSEVSGITMPDKDTKSMEIYDHFKLGHMKDGDILFFDELLEADQSVLSACLTLIESRRLMSGKKLPDIQIIAACNPTVIPGAIKPSIRQRFMFANFEVDKYQVRKYVEQVTGIKLDDSVINMVTCENDHDYNILSPRSLTKLCKWIACNPTVETAQNINMVWGTNIGSKILKCYATNEDPKLKAMKKAVFEFSPTLEKTDLDSTYDLEEFCFKLSRLENFEEIKAALANIMLEEEGETNVETVEDSEPNTTQTVHSGE